MSDEIPPPDDMAAAVAAAKSAVKRNGWDESVLPHIAWKFAVGAVLSLAQRPTVKLPQRWECTGEDIRPVNYEEISSDEYYRAADVIACLKAAGIEVEG